MSDYLTDEEQLDKLKKWWEENGLMLAGAVVISVAGVIGWNWYGERQAATVAGSSDLYVDYLRAEGAELFALVCEKYGPGSLGRRHLQKEYDGGSKGPGGPLSLPAGGRCA